MNLRESQTFKNLVNAYAGECQSHVRYQFLAYASKEHKLYEVKKAIEVIVRNDFNHARMYYTAIQTASDETMNNLEVCSGYPFKEKWNYLENFDFCIATEREECEHIYPEYARVAREEGFEDIANLFELVAQVESCHAKQLTQLRDQIKNSTLYKRDDAVKWKCSQCGHEHVAKEAPRICPLCKLEQGFVMLNLSDR